MKRNKQINTSPLYQRLSAMAESRAPLLCRVCYKQHSKCFGHKPQHVCDGSIIDQDQLENATLLSTKKRFTSSEYVITNCIVLSANSFALPVWLQKRTLSTWIPNKLNSPESRIARCPYTVYWLLVPPPSLPDSTLRSYSSGSSPCYHPSVGDTPDTKE